MVFKSNAKTPSGIVLTHANKHCKDGNIEMEVYLRELYKQVKEVEKETNKPCVEIEIVEGWKGKDNIEIFKGFTEDFVIKRHQKEKSTGEIKSSSHTIPFEDVNRLLYFIKKWKVGESRKCYDFAEIIGEKDWKEVWKKRTDVYFPLYYYPIKCLEKIGIIKYSGKGVITRLK